MSYVIRYTPQAKRDIDEIWNGVYEVSRDYDTADHYVEALLDTISKKKNFPLSGSPLRYRGLFTGFYHVNYKKYMIFYRVSDNCIEVIRVILSKCDYMKILFPED